MILSSVILGVANIAMGLLNYGLARLNWEMGNTGMTVFGVVVGTAALLLGLFVTGHGFGLF